MSENDALTAIKIIEGMIEDLKGGEEGSGAIIDLEFVLEVLLRAERKL